MKYKYLPISVSLQDRPCLVVGGGPIALRKVESLLDYDARIDVVAPDADAKLEYHAERGRISLHKREYRSGEAAAYGLVICATNDEGVNAQVHADAKQGGALVNVVDDPRHCDFIFPAVLRRDCLTAAISTDGKAPFVSGHLRLVLDNIFPDHWVRLMKLAAAFRSKVRHRWSDDTDRKNLCYAEFLDADWKRLLKELDEEELEEELTRMVEIPA